MKRTDKYPTWHRQSRNRIVSEEQLAGTPDFMIVREGSKPESWIVKPRTSAMWQGPYASAAEAMKAIEKEFA